MSNVAMSDIVIDANNVSRRFGDLTAVKNLTMQLAAGQIYGFLGPNGCGKTTTIRLFTGLLQASSGQITVLGCRLPQHAEILKQQIGYMTQKFSLYDDLTIKENLRFIATIYGLNAKAQKKRIEELLSIYHLADKQNALAGTLSGGQKQRLALAAATIHQPKLLFLDEPTSAVDPENRRDFWEKLFDLCDQEGTSILVSTHYMDEAERCHQLAILETGEVRATGSPKNLMDNLAANVIELNGESLRQIKQQLNHIPEIISAAQLGNQLRVLVKADIAEPINFLSSTLKQTSISGTVNFTQVRASLEDVFVLATGAKK